MRQPFQNDSCGSRLYTTMKARPMIRSSAMKPSVCESMVLSGLTELLEGENIPIQIYRPSQAISFGAARYAYGRKKPEPVPVPPKPIPGNNNNGTSFEDKLDKINGTVSQILKTYAEFSYGIWVPARDSLTGTVRVLVESGSILPAESEEIDLVSSGSPMRIRLYQSKEKNIKGRFLNVDSQCKSLMFIPFNIPSNTECKLKIIVQEDYNVTVICKPDDGQQIIKSTLDRLS